jgi:prepilin-type N-terminal cleavage/methylation domain-containing protein
VNCRSDRKGDKWQVTSGKCQVSRARCHAFTLIELLTVISILGIIAALTVPALKEFGKADASVGATQQLLRDVGRARQLALADRTTVYMVFVPMNFFTNTTWLGQLTPAQQSVASNLCDYQLTGYTFVAYGALGDQPGNHQWHYLTPWQNLPQGTFIAPWKFNGAYSPLPTPNPFTFYDPANSPGTFFNIYSFNYSPIIPFPTETATNNNNIFLPYIAFNYLGQLVQAFNAFDQDYTGSGVDIPLVRGSVMAAINPATKALQFGAPQIIETPAGNGTNITFNVLHIDPLTGRATMLYHQVQ